MFALRRYRWLLLIGGLTAAACTSRLTSQEPDADDPADARATAEDDPNAAAEKPTDETLAHRELRDIAERAFDESMSFYETAEATPYEVDQASRRWLREELKLAGSKSDKVLAQQAHMDRMRTLADYAQWRSSEMEFFVAQAELELNELAPDPKFGATILARKALQGEWEVVSAEEDGIKAKKPDLKSLTIVGRRGEFTFRLGAARALIAIDPTATPAEFDVFGFNEAFPFGGRGIYKLEDDQLTICWATSGERPTDFATQPDDNAHMYVLERGGPRESGSGLAP